MTRIQFGARIGAFHQGTQALSGLVHLCQRLPKIDSASQQRMSAVLLADDSPQFQDQVLLLSRREAEAMSADLDKHASPKVLLNSRKALLEAQARQQDVVIIDFDSQKRVLTDLSRVDLAESLSS